MAQRQKNRATSRAIEEKPVPSRPAPLKRPSAKNSKTDSRDQISGGKGAPGKALSRWQLGPSAIALKLGPMQRARPAEHGAWRRETFLLSREEALEKTIEWFSLYPKEIYRTEIEFWRICEDGQVEFILRRLSKAG